MPRSISANVLAQSQASLPDAVTVVPITPPVGANQVTLSATTQNVRVTFDGSAPSATVGIRIIAGGGPATFNFSPLPGLTLRAMAETGTAKLDYVFTG